MESATEAARRAVNGILDVTESDTDRCTVWELDDPTVFTPMKTYDKMRYKVTSSPVVNDGASRTTGTR